MRFSQICFSFIFIGLHLCSSAQTVSVNKAGTDGAFQTISDALNSFIGDVNPSPNVINVTDGGIYDEAITILAPVTLQAVGTSATLALEDNANGTGGRGGIFINLPSELTTGSVVIRNFAIIPATATKNNEPLTAIENFNNNLFLELDQCILAPNDGNNLPLVTDGYTNRVLELISTQASYNPAIVQFADDGIVLGKTDSGQQEGAGVELLFLNSVLSHFRYDYNAPSPKPVEYGISMPNAYGTTPPYADVFRRTSIVGNSAVSFCQDGINVCGDLETITTGSKILLRGHARNAIEFNGPSPNFRNLDNLLIVGTSGQGIWDDGYGPVRAYLTNSIIFSVVRNLWYVGKPANDVASGTMHVENCTLVPARTTVNTSHAYRLEVGTQTNIDIRDSILCGKSSQPTNNYDVFSCPGINDVSLQGTAIVTTGIFALRAAPFSLGTSATVSGSYITDDPQFVDSSENDCLLPDFLDVQNPAYASANSIGGPLGGGADYVGVSSEVKAWEMY